MPYLYQSLTQKIIAAYYTVYNTLGYGFLEKVYENAMLQELDSYGLKSEKQIPISVFYKGLKVGEYFADIIVDNKIILELKASKQICLEHEYQLINYLKATDIELGLLLNFGKKPEIRRKIFSSKKRIGND